MLSGEVTPGAVSPWFPFSPFALGGLLPLQLLEYQGGGEAAYCGPSSLPAHQSPRASWLQKGQNLWPCSTDLEPAPGRTVPRSQGWLGPRRPGEQPSLRVSHPGSRWCGEAEGKQGVALRLLYRPPAVIKSAEQNGSSPRPRQETRLQRKMLPWPLWACHQHSKVLTERRGQE